MTVTRFPRAPLVPANAGDATFVIDTNTWAVTEAGRLAAIVLGRNPASAPRTVFDTGMPAVATLRTFLKSGERASADPVKLILWVRRRRLAALCMLERVGSDPPASPLVRVAISNIHDLIAELNLTPNSLASPEPLAAVQRSAKSARLRLDTASVIGEMGDVRAAPALMTPAPARDDSVTLQMIARRIEDGVKQGDRVERPVEQMQSGDPPSDQNAEGVAVDEPPIRPPTAPPEDNDNIAMAEPTPLVRPECVSAEMTAPEITAPAIVTHEFTQRTLENDRAALNKLLAQTAHEIKTPLSAISAASEIIRDERLGPAGNERYRTYAADIHASATHALAVVDRLLTMPSVSLAEKFEIVPASSLVAVGNGGLDLNAVISATAVEMKPLMEARQLELTVRLDPSDPRISADAVGFKQALLNLLTNAMKFTAPHGSLQLETVRIPSQGVSVRLQDTGFGMTKGAIARILHAEMNESEITRNLRPGAGLGLGLRQVRAFCTEHNAELSIDSTLGRGTLVTLLFQA